MTMAQEPDGQEHQLAAARSLQTTNDEHQVAAWTERYAEALLGVFGTPKTVLVRGEGVYVWDADGKKYLDLLAGIAVNALGHAHPTLTGAIGAQLATLGHVSNFFTTPAQVALAERLLDLAGAPGGSRAFFASSGTEANEAALKIARRNRGPHGRRTRVIALDGSFHGRTLGALSLTSKPAYREPFEPLPGGVDFVPTGDIAAMRAAFESDPGTVSAVFVELIQGEGGVRPLPRGYLEQVRALTHENGALLVIDEVQTGVGRTGYWFAHQDERYGGVMPDVVTLAKGLGGGMPIAAVLAYGREVSGLLLPGQHGTTFGGNPVAAAAALATLGVIERDHLLDNVRRTGAQLRKRLVALADRGGLVDGVRGAGLLLGIQLSCDVAGQVVDAALAAGFIVNAVTPSTMRLAPPLLITEAQLAPFVDWLASVSDDPGGHGIVLPETENEESS